MNIINKVTGQLAHITTYDPVTGEITGFAPIGNVELGPVSNITITGGTAGQALVTDGNGNLQFSDVAGSYDDANVSAYLDGNITTDIVPAGTTQSLGSLANPWQDLYLSGNTMYIAGIPLSVGTNSELIFNSVPLVTTTGTETIETTGNITAANITATSAITADGNITANAGYFFVGDGGFLSNVGGGGSYGNADVEILLGSGNVDSDIITTGNVLASALYAGDANSVTPGTAFLTSNSQGTVFGLVDQAGIEVIAGAPLTLASDQGITFEALSNTNIILGGLTTNAFIVLSNLVSDSSIASAANITANHFIGDGSLLTGLPAGYSDANVETLLSGGTVTTDIITTANVTGAYIIGDGSELTNITGANVTGVVANATFATTAGSADSVAGANVTGVVANATFATTSGSADSVAGANVIGVVANATFATTSGSADSVAGANVTGQVANALVAGTVYEASQPTITSVGTLTSLTVSGDATVEGNTVTDDIIGRTSGVTVSATGTNQNITLVPTGTGYVDVSGASVKNLLDPVDVQDAATKAYVDSVAEGLTVQDACVATTSADLATVTGDTVTYDNGTDGVGATLTLSTALTTLDGVTLNNGDRVLIKNETDQATNGIYTWATGGTVLTRATNYDTTSEIGGGDFVFITGGTIYGNSGWVQVDNIATIGTDPIQFTQFSGAASYTAGTGLTLTGTQFSITDTAVTAGTYGNASTTVTVAVNAQGQLTSVTQQEVVANAETLSGTTLNSTVVNSSLTSVGTLTDLAVTGNVTAGFLYGDGSNITGLPAAYSNADVANYLPTYTGNLDNVDTIIALTIKGEGGNIANIQGGNVQGTVANAVHSQLSDVATVANSVDGANVVGEVANANYAAFSGQVVDAAQANITSVGSLTSLEVLGTTDLVDLNASGQVVLNGVTITEQQLTTTGAGFEISGTDQGVQLQSTDTANSTFTLVFADNTGVGLVTNEGEIIVGIDGNVTVTDSMSVGGDLSTAGNLTVTGDIGSSGNIVAATIGNSSTVLFGDGANITGLPAAYSNADVANYLPTYTGNLDNVSSVGNATTVLFGDGANITGLPAQYGNAEVSAYLASGADTAGFLTFGDIQTTTGNGSFGGNVDALAFSGDGSQLTNLDGSEVTGQVANALVSGTVTTAAQPNITSVGTLTGLTVSGVSNLSAIGNVIITGGSTGQALTTDGAGNLSWATVGSAGAPSNIANGTSNVDIATSGGNVTMAVAGEQVFELTGNSVSLGYSSGSLGSGTQGIDAVAIGTRAGQADQFNGAIAIGNAAGQDTQFTNAIAIGSGAGYNLQGSEAIAIGTAAGAGDPAAFPPIPRNAQGTQAIAIGSSAGVNYQGANSVAIGTQAGANRIGINSVAVGAFAGAGEQAANSIVINATGANLNALNSGLYAAPVRNDTGNTTNVVYYNTTTKEVTYGPGATPYGNTEVADYLPTYTGSMGNITSITASGDITANSYIGDGSQLTGLPAAYTDADVSFYLATGLNTANIETTANINAGGNVTASGNITTSGNVSATGFSGSGAALTSLTGANVTGTVANATFATTAGSADSVAGANVTGQVANALVAGTVYEAAQPNITSVGTLSTLEVTGNVLFGNANIGNLVVTGTTTTANVSDLDIANATIVISSGANALVSNGAGLFIGSEVGTVGSLTYLNASDSWNSSLLFQAPNFTTPGNVTAAHLVGEASNLSNITAANITGTVGSATTAGTVTTAAQPNITSLGTLTGLTVSGVSNLSAVGNVIITGGTTGQVLSTDGAGNLSWSTVSGGGSYGDSNVTSLLAAYGSNTITTTGNITAGNFQLTGNITKGTGNSIQFNATNFVVGLNQAAIVAVNPDEDTGYIALGTVNLGGGAQTIAIGPSAQSQAGGAGSISIGYKAAPFSPGAKSIAIGQFAGFGSFVGTKLGANTIAIGYGAANGGSAANVIILNASGANFTPSTSQANSFYVNPVRNDTGNTTNVMYYNTTTKEVTYGPGVAAYSNADVANYLPTYTGNLGNVTNITATGNIVAATIGNASTVLFGDGANIAGLPAPYTDTDVSLYLASGIDSDGYTTTGNITTTADVSANNLSVTANIASGNNITAVGNISANGNIIVNGTIGTGNISGANNISGLTLLASNAILVGSTVTTLPNTVARFGSNANSYTQITFQNLSTGTDATSDIVLTTDNGNDTVNFVDLGIINSAYDPNTPTNSLGNVVFASDAYLYAQGNVGNTSQSGGNLVLGATVANKSVKIFAGGNTNAFVTATFTSTAANLKALNVAGVSNLGPVGNVTITGGTNGQVLTTNGSGVLSWTTVSGGGSSASISNGTSNVNIATSGGNVTMAVNGNSVATFAAANVILNGVRNDTANVANVVTYNQSTKEVTYANTLSLSGNITGANIIAGNATDFVTLRYSAANTVSLSTTRSGFSSVNQMTLNQNGTIVGYNAGAGGYGANSVVIGVGAGGSTSGNSVSVGTEAATYQPGVNSVAIGYQAGQGVLLGAKLGANSVVIGTQAAAAGSANNVIILNATGANFTPSTSQANSFYVNPIRNDTGNTTNAVYYNTTTKEVTYGPAGGGGSTTIDRSVITGNVTLTLAQAGTFLYSTTATAQTVTIPTNASVAFPIGTSINVVLNGAGSVALTPDSGVSLYLAGNSTSATRTVSPYGLATLLQVDTDVWFVNGTGVY